MSRRDKEVAEDDVSRRTRKKVKVSTMTELDERRTKKRMDSSTRGFSQLSGDIGSSHENTSSSMHTYTRETPRRQSFFSRRMSSISSDEDEDEDEDVDMDEDGVERELPDFSVHGNFPDSWFIGPDDVPIPGGPTDASLLKSFGGHVAIDLWQGMDRGCLKYSTRGPVLNKWNLDDLRHVAARELVEGSKLGHLPSVCHSYFDMTLISAFVERWQPDTNTFHMPFGEMTITLHDVYHILHLPINGNAVAFIPPKEMQGGSKAPRLSLDECLAQLAEMFRLPSVNLIKERGIYGKGGVAYSKIRELCTHERATYADEAQGYLFYMLGCTLFPDKGNDRIRPYTFWPLHDVNEIHKYAWGAGTLAYLYRQLGIATRASTKTICGCLTLLQCWIYSYFPSICRIRMSASWRPTDPFALRYSKISGTNITSDEKLVEYRRRLDGLTADEVMWTPFGDESWNVHGGRSMWCGYLHMMDYVEPYHPHRCLRQFDRVQIVPSFDAFFAFEAERPKNSTNYSVVHHASPLLYSAPFSIAEDYLNAPRVRTPSDAADDYLDWYIPKTHPKIVGDSSMYLDADLVLNRVMGLMDPYGPGVRPEGWILGMSNEDVTRFQSNFDQMFMEFNKFKIAQKSDKAGTATSSSRGKKGSRK